MNEAVITINCVVLTEAQSMALRVAACAFLSSMREPDPLGGDGHGRAMAAAYDARISEVIRLMTTPLVHAKSA